jgi:hypothetical protein
MKLSKRLQRLYLGLVRAEMQQDFWTKGTGTAVYRLSDWRRLMARLESMEKAALKLEAKK